jgi:farnesyl diphosphate synthase
MAMPEGKENPADIIPALASTAEAVDALLMRFLSPEKRHARLIDAIRHAVFAGGKRMRPFLVLESARLFDIADAAPLHVAAALEAIHCYSLVHDDLPAMDNDDMRRGQPTVHRAYDEATAVLAGDALLTLAFTILASPSLIVTPSRRIRLISALAKAAGLDGMLSGQMLDLAAEGRFDPTGKPENLGVAAIRRLQSLKTGALIEFAVMAGAVLAPRASAKERSALSKYGKALGLAFQIRDDILDVEGETGRVGKALAKDAAAGKATFIGLMGVEGARRELDKVSETGRRALMDVFGNRAGMLAALLDFNRLRDR